MIATCVHRYFLRDYHHNARAIERRVTGNYLVRCGHCQLSLCGERGHDGPMTEIVWRFDGNTFFGEFYVYEEVAAA